MSPFFSAPLVGLVGNEVFSRLRDGDESLPREGQFFELREKMSPWDSLDGFSSILLML